MRVKKNTHQSGISEELMSDILPAGLLFQHDNTRFIARRFFFTGRFTALPKTLACCFHTDIF